MSRTYVTIGFGSSAQMAILSADMYKCFSANLSTHRFLFREQLKRSRDLKGGFILDAEHMQKILETQLIRYPDIGDGKRFHPERLRAQMEYQVSIRPPAEVPVEKEEKPPAPTLLSYYYHEDYTNIISFSYDPAFVGTVTDCRQGYRTVDKDALQSLRSRYARLLFIYLSGKSDNFTFNESTLRELFGIQGNYKRITSLKPRLECVKEEFKKLGVDFRWEFEGRGPSRRLYIQAKGMSQYHPSVREEKELQPQVRDLTGEVVDFLKKKVKMDDKGIASNKKTFLQYIYYYGEKGLIDFLSKKMKTPGYYEKRNRIGWLIGAVKDEVAKDHSTGRVEEKKADVDNMEITDPRIAEMVKRTAKKINSS